MKRLCCFNCCRNQIFLDTLAGQPFSEIRNALPFRNDEAGRALRDRVDAAITTLKENGKLREISEKWLGADVTVPAS